MKDALKKKGQNTTPGGSRSYSTMVTPTTGGGGFDIGLVDLNPAALTPAIPGAKFGLPSLPLPTGSHVKRRYDAVVDQVTNLLMRHGEKSKAQRVRTTVS
jgi:small subunit ribosomal protein S7